MSSTDHTERAPKTRDQIAAQINVLAGRLVSRALERQQETGHQNTGGLVIARTLWENFVSVRVRNDANPKRATAETTWSIDIGSYGSVRMGEKYLRAASVRTPDTPAMETVNLTVSPGLELTEHVQSKLNPGLAGNVYIPYEREDLDDAQVIRAAARILWNVRAAIAEM